MALAASALAVTACASERPTGEAIRGLVILSGDVGKARLTVHATSDGSPRQVELVDPATAWISGAPSGIVVATLADGRLAVRDVDGDPADRWTIVPSDKANGADTKFFGIASPDGKRAAALTLGSAGQFGIAITDLAKGTTITFPLDGEPLLTTPAWLDDNRIGIVVVDTTAGGAVAIASVSTGDLTGGPANVKAMAMSGDGTVAAWVSSTDGRLYASNSRSWLLGEEAGTIAIEGTAGPRPARSPSTRPAAASRSPGSMTTVRSPRSPSTAGRAKAGRRASGCPYRRTIREPSSAGFAEPGSRAGVAQTAAGA